MASRYTLEEALEAILDDDFGLSDGGSSDKEGEDIYGYVGESVLRRSDVNAVGDSIVNAPDCFDHDGDEDEGSERADPLPSERAGSPPGEHERLELSGGESVGFDMPSDDDDTSSSEADSSDTCRGPRTGRGSTSAAGVCARSSTRGRGRARGRSRACGRGCACSGRGRASGGVCRGCARGSQSRARGQRRNVRSSTGRADDREGGLPVIDGTWDKNEPTAMRYEYNRTSGPTSHIDRNSSPAQLFCRYFTDEVWELLVEETNRYANANSSDARHARPWYDTTVPEMKAFVGMLIIMGIVQLPRLELYWTTSHPLIATPGIASVMPRVRFEQLFRFLHLNDSNNQIPSGNPGHDKLFKVRRLLDLVTPKFEYEYVPHKEVTVDEAMIPFKGRLSFKQYMKDKPTKWGIKVFTLCDATNCYVQRLQIYTGRNLERNNTAVGLCSQVVLDLMTGIEKLGHELYTDNYYTSPQLYQCLYDRGINACGTARTNRLYFPQDIVYKRK